MAETTIDGVEFVTHRGAKVQVVGRASRDERPYVRLEGADGEYLGSIDAEEAVALRDALTRALRGWGR